MSAFPVLMEAPCKPITPNEAVGLIAGVSISDPWQAASYCFEDGSSTGPAIQAAREKIFHWLNGGDLIGAIEVREGVWRRLSLGWLRSLRRVQRNWELPADDDGKKELIGRTELIIDELPDRVIGAGERQIEGLPWFIDEHALLECKDGLAGLAGDDRLVAQMRAGVSQAKYPNLFQASMALAKSARGGGTWENRADRLRRLERLTRLIPQTSPKTSP